MYIARVVTTTVMTSPNTPIQHEAFARRRFAGQNSRAATTSSGSSQSHR